MIGRSLKQITLTIFRQEHIRMEWYFDFNGKKFQIFFSRMAEEMKKSGIHLNKLHNNDVSIKVNSYADLLNAVKISSPGDFHSNICIGHIIGVSEHLDIMEDISAALQRMAFAPETIPPADEFRKVCHNCGCGC
jgi:hypothetical protein